MRHTRIAIALAVLPLTLGGCAAMGGTGSTTEDSSAAGKADGESWVRTDTGTRTPSPVPKRGTASPTVDPTVSAPAPDPGCTRLWPRTEPVMIPVAVTPGAGSLKVEWPAQYSSNYRVTAVPQDLVVGDQPEPAWKKVAAGSGCAVTATLTGLTPDRAYIVWLDAPNSGREVDGTRHLYSGRSGVVYPK